MGHGIADFERIENMEITQISWAIQYRSLDQNYWL